MAGLACDFDDQTIRKAKRRPLAKLRHGRGHDLCLLKRDALVAEQHLYRGRDSGGRQVVDTVQNPGHFHQDQVRNPNPAFHKALGRCHLLGIIARQQPHQHVRINSAHGAFS